MPPIADGVIPDDAGLLRRVHPKQIVDDKTTGQLRPSSAAFTDPEMSVDVEPFLAERGLDWTFSLRDHPTHSLVRFPADAARRLGQDVRHTPKPDNEAHADVLGRKSSPTKNGLVAASMWVRLGDRDL